MNKLIIYVGTWIALLALVTGDFEVAVGILVAWAFWTELEKGSYSID